MAAVITATALAAGVRTLDPSALRAAAAAMGIGSPAAYLAGAAAWTLANSLVEEYVWRWFVLAQCERLVGPPAAVVLSAALFTAHHVLALGRYLTPGLTLLASAGVFAGGVVWAGLYLRYRSIWPGWLSHVLADVAVFTLGWSLLFP
jgi:membrane protease YdiL (CAAX protease family)